MTIPDSDLDLDAAPKRYFDDVRVEALEPRLAKHGLTLPPSPEDPRFEPMLRDLGLLDPDLARDVRSAVRDELAEESRMNFIGRAKKSDAVRTARNAPARVFRTDNHKNRLQVNPMYVRGALLGLAAIAAVAFIFAQPKEVTKTGKAPVDLNTIPKRDTAVAAGQPPVPETKEKAPLPKAPSKSPDPRETLSGLDDVVNRPSTPAATAVQVSNDEPPIPAVETTQIQPLNPEAGLRVADEPQPPQVAINRSQPSNPQTGLRVSDTPSTITPTAVTPRETPRAVTPERTTPQGIPSRQTNAVAPQRSSTSGRLSINPPRATKPVILGENAPTVQPIEVALGGASTVASTAGQTTSRAAPVRPVSVAPITAGDSATPGNTSVAVPQEPMVSVRGNLSTGQGGGSANAGARTPAASGVLGVSARGQEPAVASRVRGVLSVEDQQEEQASATGGAPTPGAANTAGQPGTGEQTQSPAVPKEADPTLVTISAAKGQAVEQQSGLHSASVGRASTGGTTAGNGATGVMSTSAAASSSGLQSVQKVSQKTGNVGLMSVNGGGSTSSGLPSGQTSTMPSATATAKTPYRFGDMLKAQLLTGAAFLQAEGESGASGAGGTTGGQVVYAQGEDGSRWRGTATLAANGRVMIAFDRVLVGEQDFAISGDATGLEDARYQGVQPQVRRETPEAGRQILQALLGSAATFVQQSAQAGTTTTTGTTVTKTQGRPNFWLTSLGAVAQAVSLPSGRISRVVVSELPAGTSLTVVVRGQ